MDRTSVNWEGYFLAMVTPFTREGDLDERALRGVVDLAIANGVDGLVPAGCTGEWWTLTDAERFQVFRVVVEQTAGRATVVGGACAIQTNSAIELVKMAKEAGCDGAMLTAPAYALPREREIIHYFERVAAAVHFPIMLYNNPNRVRRALTPELVDRLADISTVVAIKDSSGDIAMQERTFDVCHQRIRYFMGGTRNASRIVPRGGDGFVDSAIAHLAGREGSDYYRALRAGDLARADTLVPDSLAHAIHDLTWEEAGMFPASLKEAMNLMGRPGGYPREPLLPLTDEERETMRRRLTELGLMPVAVGA